MCVVCVFCGLCVCVCVCFVCVCEEREREGSATRDGRKRKRGYGAHTWPPDDIAHSLRSKRAKKRFDSELERGREMEGGSKLRRRGGEEAE